MAKDKVEIEVDPSIKPSGAQKLQAQFQKAYEVTNETKQKIASVLTAPFAKAMQGGASLAASMGLGGVAGAAASIGAPVAKAVGGAASAVGGMAMSTVGTANPATMEMFNQALEDIAGVIGQTLTPVIEALIPWIRTFGDFLASILPSAEQMREVMAPLAELLEVLRDAIEPIIPIIKEVLADALWLLAKVVKYLVEAIKWVLDMLGVEVKKGGKSNWGSSMGAAAGSSSYSSVGDATKGMVAGAFGMGVGTVQDKQLKVAEQQLEVMKAIRDMNKGGGIKGFPQP